ncbi:MAG: hypothetical protein A3J60_03835 [Candidatus Pacebacteria bacterium RIFCSPHIGHO2_02_FULL_46_9]|nr:MAG: hypothetical protein A3J60_03835 [Candidatus Pacebacteria bacterium RIFCSPHIGHO2_02_FULL_46_9]
MYKDKSFSFVLKLPPVSAMIKQALKLKAGSSKPSQDTVGTLSQDQLRTIATEKLPDLNTTDVEQAMKTVAGTARSMGVTVTQ